MRIPAGSHTVEFKFEPIVFNTGGKIASIASIVLYLLLISVLYVEWKKSRRSI
jgi:uncharacterized membrane protein YfhO